MDCSQTRKSCGAVCAYQGRQVAIITNKVVAPLYLDALLEALDGLQVDVMQMDDEAEKIFRFISKRWTSY